MTAILEWLLIGALIATYLLCHGLRAWAHHRDRLDIPNHRSAHKMPTPTSAGLVMVVVFAAAVVCLGLWGDVDTELVVAFMGVFLIAIIGFLDDIKPIGAGLRFSTHIIASGWIVFWLGGIPSIAIFSIEIDPGWLGFLIGIVYLAWLLNLYNFMDGMDGLAASEAVFVLAAVWLIAGYGHGDEFGWRVVLILLSVCLGFLIINWPSAKIFMGDIGSGFLGLSLGTLSIYTAREEFLSMWCWVILLACFIVDASVTLVVRLMRKEKVYEAHNLHVYQHASRIFGDSPVLYTLWSINLAWLLPMAWWADSNSEWGVLITCLAYLPIVVFSWRSGSGQIVSKLSRTSVK